MSLRTHLSFVCCALLAGATSAGAQSQPAEFQRSSESGVPATVTGQFTALVVDDFDHGRAEVKYFIRDSRTGRTFWVHYEDEAPTRRSGSVVTLSGRATTSDLYVPAASTELNAPSFGTLAEMPPAAPVTGDQKTLVVIANFTNTVVACQPSTINDTMFSDPAGISVDALYREMSSGNVSFSGTTVGPFTIPFASSSACDPGTWASAADTQAAASGIDVSAYPRRLYVMPSNSCGATGYGTMSSVPSSAWVFACDLKGAYAHELGHNLGMNHGSTPDMEYGDITDAMTSAASRLRPTNAPHRHQMGWLPGSAIRLATEGGVYYLAPLESNPALAASPQAIAVAKPDTGEYYYFSYRHAIGFDNYISANYLDTLSVHRYKGDGSASRTYLLAGLANGESFVDDVNGIRVTMVGHDDTRATVEIQLTPTCIAALPSIAVPASLQGGAAGSVVTFTGTVTNRDSSICAPASFSLGTSVPTGWSTSTSPAVVSLTPGQASDFTVTVTSAAGAAVGTYSLTVGAADTAASSHQASALVSYSLTSLCVAKPPVLAVSPSSQRGAPGTTVTYALALTNMDSGACASTSFVVSPMLQRSAAASGAARPKQKSAVAMENATDGARS